MALKSLRSQLLAWLLLPLIVYAILTTWIAYGTAKEMATAVQDRLLLGSARIIAEQITFEDGMLQVVVPPAALELFQSESHDKVYYRITGPDGTLLAGYSELPTYKSKLHAEEAVYFDATFRGQDIRLVAFEQPIFSKDMKGLAVVEVGETLQSHAQLTTEIWQQTFRHQWIVLILVFILAWIGLQRSYAPILRLRNQMHKRELGALHPLQETQVPAEFTPLVHAINDYIKRLDDHMSAHGIFIANASHQLRTPLTLLNTQVIYARRCADVESKEEALSAIYDTLQHAIRLVNQLLTFSTAEAGIGHPHKKIDVDLADTAKCVIEALATMAQAKNIDLGAELCEEPAIVQGTPALIYELIANLVDNALRYTPPNGVVTAKVEHRIEGITLSIEDNGPGIPEEERGKVFERFYRLHHEQSDGCGLGLAIVREIAVASAAAIDLSSPKEGTGLIVTVTFST
ncbi:MAG TPA: sensor histidine kinase [Burkholderiaceae bacterium]